MPLSTLALSRVDTRDQWGVWVQVLYALTAGIAGYVAAVNYKIMGGGSWVRNTLLTATLFCGPMLVRPRLEFPA